MEYETSYRGASKRRPRNDRVGNGWMLGLWANKREGPAISADFKHALMRQVLRTELIRIKALIGTTVLLGSLILIIHAVDPHAIQKLLHRRLHPSEALIVLVPVVLVVLLVHL